MRRAVFAVLALAAACPLSAQSRRFRDTDDVPVSGSVSLDIAAAVDHAIRANVEFLALGRVTFGVGVSATKHAERQPGWPTQPSWYEANRACSPEMLSLCIVPWNPTYYGTYRAWTADLSARWYPSPFSFRNGGARVAIYAGGSLGYQWRTWDETTIWYYRYGCGVDYPCPLESADTVTYPPPYYPPYPIPTEQEPARRILSGLEPAVELGVRLIPVGPLMVEVGGRFRLVTVDDPFRRRRPGDVESRLTVSAGLAW